MIKLKIFCFILVLMFFVSCSETNNKINPLLIISQNQKSITIFGDSMAACVSLYGKSDCWDGMQDYADYGSSGAPIESVEDKIMSDTQHYKTVILFCGYNNIKHADQTIESIIQKYKDLYNSISADKILCIAVPPMNHTLSNVWYPEGGWITNDRISQFNIGVESICGEDNYIDLYSYAIDADGECLVDLTIDGIHPSEKAYKFIINNLNN